MSGAEERYVTGSREALRALIRDVRGSRVGKAGKAGKAVHLV
ncbi:hypothetical protein [Streptomyces sp. URMC 124]